ncbi:dicarboxylate/amino acid:cation symporter [Candidatus Poribacteria bacterium]|nr:dicarboxylate/amino acid:cation symporter [Candidatus Poribacteria bacterium]
MTSKHSNWILVGIIAGIVLAGLSLPVFGERMTSVAFLGQFFLTALKMVVVPLVIASVITGMTSLGDIRRMGRVGLRTLAYYGVTTAMAVALGLILVLMIQPGAGVSTEGLEVDAAVAAKRDLGFTDILLSVVSPNIMAAIAEGQMLPVIVFSLVFGGILTTLGEKGKPVTAFFDGVNEAMMKFVQLLMWLAPIGIFGLVASKFASMPPEKWSAELARIGRYMMTVLAGLGIHGLLVLPAICWLLSRRNPFRLIGQMFPALLTAWSTASSSATLPVTIECAEDRARMDERATGFVLPLGATVNMDGTALYEAVAAVFIAQAYGIDLAFGELVKVFIMATLVSIGAAGIPQAGLFMMVIVLTAVKLPLEGVTLILVIDWFLDRFRTTVNVWGDVVGTAYIHRVLEAPARDA